MGDCFSHVSKTLLSHTLYKLNSRRKAINLLRFLNMYYTLIYLLIYLLIFYLCLYLFVYLVESSKVSEWKEKVPRLVLLFVKKKEWDVKHDLGPSYMEKNWDHYTFLGN